MLTFDTMRLNATRSLIAHAAKTLQGDLAIEMWNGEVVPLGPDARQDIRIVVRSPQAVRRLLRKPRLMTIFELYAEQEIDIVGASPLAAADRWDHTKGLRTGRSFTKMQLARAAAPFLVGGEGKPADLPAHAREVAAHYASGRDDKELIAFHYDVSNEFYALFLDPEMVYSSAYFPSEDAALAKAQQVKLDRICQKLQIKPGDRLLDIGSGWGGLICHAARHYGATCHGVTLSERQLEWCEAKIAREGLQDKVRVELRDYRTLEGKGDYDAVAQIEMFEHVGLDNHDRHFLHMRALMAPGGRYLHQASVRRATPNLDDFRKETPYMSIIRRFIFPGGDMDHIGMTATNLERHQFEIHDIEPMRMHFHLTLRHWVENLWARREEASALVGWERTRLWLLYMSMCAKSFERGVINVFQTVATKRVNGPSLLPLRRAEWFEPKP